MSEKKIIDKVLYILSLLGVKETQLKLSENYLKPIKLEGKYIV